MSILGIELTGAGICISCFATEDNMALVVGVSVLALIGLVVYLVLD